MKIHFNKFQELTTMQAKKLIIRASGCEARFSSIDFCCGDVRVQGWVSAPSKSRGFDFCGVVAKALGRKHIGGFCMDEEGLVDFPFSFDESPKYLFVKGHLKQETLEEAKTRIIKEIRKAKRSLPAADVNALLAQEKWDNDTRTIREWQKQQ